VPLQFAPRILQPIAIRSRRGKSLPTVRPSTTPHPKDRTMNATYATPMKTRLVAAFLAFVTSAVVLGSTVAGFQPASDSTLVVLDRVTVRATAVN
jgi:hypothetical protein